MRTTEDVKVESSRVGAALNVEAAAAVRASGQTSGFYGCCCFSNPGIRCFSMCFQHFAVPTRTGIFFSY